MLVAGADAIPILWTWKASRAAASLNGWTSLADGHHRDTINGMIYCIL